MKKYTVLAISLVVLGGGLFTASPVLAVGQNAQDTLVTRIATKFNLNKADVQAVFDEFRTERRQTREAKYEAYLNTLVKQGKITSDQKSLLIAKRKELATWFQNERSNWKNLTPEARKAQIEAKVKEMKTWAEQNHVDPKYLMHARGKQFFHMGHGFGKMK